MDVTYEEHQVPVSCIVNGEVKKFVEDLWLRELARKEGKSGKGGNKLYVRMHCLRKIVVLNLI